MNRISTLAAGTLAAAAIVALSGCGGSSASSETPAAPEPRVTAMGTGPSQSGFGLISDAVCNDLGANGLSLFQLKASTQKTTDMSGEEFARWLRGHLSVGCPQMLQDESVRGILTAWGVDPDA